MFKGHRGRVPERMPAYDAATGRSYFIPGTGTTSASVDVIEVSADGKLLATGSNDKTVEVWSLGTGKQLVVFQGHKAPIASVAISPDGKTIASSDEQGLVKTWNPLTGCVSGTLSTKTQVAVAWLRNKELSTTSSDGKTSIWNAKGLTLAKTIRRNAPTTPVETNPAQVVSFSADGSRIAVAENGDDLTHRSRPYAVIYDAKSGAKLYSFRIAKPYASDLSSNGKLYAVAGMDYSRTTQREVVQIWNAP